MLKTLLIILILFSVTNTLNAQNDCPCCDETHKQFDFWIGNWIVLDSLGNKAGENKVSKIEDGCIITEHWTGAKGGTGSSYNYYDKSDSTWNQLWVDNKGNILKLKGQFESDKMILKSDLVKDKNDNLYSNQITWSKNEDGTVSQLWEIIDKNNQPIKNVFLGIYNRQ